MAIPTAGLLAEPRLSRLLRRFINGSRTVGYVTTPATGPAASFIDQAFRWLEARLPFDFQRRSSTSGSAIAIRQVEQIGGPGSNTIGITTSGPSRFDVRWKDLDGRASLSWVEQAVIIHEIGHTMGLSHPYDKPWNRSYDTRDTIMSYNNNRADRPWFTSSDLRALRRLWTDPPGPNRRAGGERESNAMRSLQVAAAEAANTQPQGRPWDNHGHWWAAARPTGLEGWSSG